MFAERGFESTTVRDICQAAGANVAAVNYYFGDKERLYVEAVVRAHRWRLDQAQLPDWNADTPPRKKLADFIETFFRRVLGGPDDTWHTQADDARDHESDGGVRGNRAVEHPAAVRDSAGILRELLPADDERRRVASHGVQHRRPVLVLSRGRPVIRNLIDESEYATYDVDKLAQHVTEFTLAALDARVGSSAQTAGATR